MIRGVIFDADGTLLDSMGFWTSTVYDLVAMSGTEPEQGLIDTLNPMSMTEGAQYMKARYDIPMSLEEMIAEENRRVHRFYKTQVTLRPGAAALIPELSARGIPMAVASATERELIVSALEHTGILEAFTEVFSCSDVGAGKDKPDVFLRACEALGTKPEETLVVEDSPTAIETVKAAGFPAAFVEESEPLDETVKKAFQREEEE